MTKKASLEGKGRSILLGEESSDPLPVPLSELEGDLDAEEDVAVEAKAEDLEEEEDIDWSGMMEDEVAAAGAAETDVEDAEDTSLPAIEHYYPEEASPELDPPEAADEPDLAVSEIEGADSGDHSSSNGDVDWGPMMEHEVSTAESPEGTPLPTIEHFYPPEEPALPESELNNEIETPVETPEPSPEIVSEGPPAAPEAEQPPAEDAAEATTTAPNVRLGGLLAGTDLTKEVEPPGPVSEEVEIRESDRPTPEELTDEEEEEIIKRVSRKYRRELFERISELYSVVPTSLSATRQTADRKLALLLLSEARDIVIEDPRQFDQAEHKVAKVEAIIAHAMDVEKWSHYYGNRLIAYLVGWFVVMMTGIVLIHVGAFTVWLQGIASTVEEGITPTTIEPLFFTMLWGGVGGVVGGLYSLWRHISEFDKQYTIWYTLQPISGLVLGGIIHVITLTGFLSMSIQAGAGSAAQATKAAQWFPALLAVAFGFRQNNFYGLLDRIIELIGQPQEEGGEDDESE